MIRYSLTQEVWTQEDSEIGEPSLSELISEHDYDNFRTLVRVLAYAEPSEYPPTPRTGLYFTVENEPDLFSGVVEVLGYHPLTQRDARYMVKAWMVGNGRHL
jgi:hypothetical protein